VGRAITAITREIERIRTELIPADELDGGKRYMTGVLPLRLETSDGISRSILEMELFDLGFDYISNYPAIVDALTPEYVGEVAKEHLSSTNYVVSVAGPPVEGMK
jgi:zinc protease